MVYLRPTHSVRRRAISVVVALLFTCALAFAAAPRASAAAGDVDGGFAGDGVASTPALTNMDGGYATAIKILPDGRFVTVGQLQFNSGPADLAVQRHNSDGSLDTTFSGDGVAVVNVPGTFGTYGVDVGVQPSGKIVAVAQLTAVASPAQMLLAIYRFNDDGTLDDTFDGDSGTGNGVVRLYIGEPGPPNPTDRVWDAIVEPNGRIVVAGESSPIGVLDGSMVMARFTAEGLLDTGFSGDGRLDFDPTLYYERGLTLAAHPQGGYVVAGVGRRQAVPFANVQGLFRITDAGALDTTFTGDSENASLVPGQVVVSIGADPDDVAAAWALTVQSDGKILTGGTTTNGSSTAFVPYVARFDADGSFDAGFGSGGRAFPTFPDTNGQIDDLAIDSNGRIYASGNTFGTVPQIGVVARLTPSGALDPTYGGGVAPVTTLGSALGLAITADGSQLASGSSGQSVGLSTVRLLGDPPPDDPATPPAIPTATITSPKGKRVSRKRSKRFAGTAGPAGGVEKVEIALQRVDRRQLKRTKRCLWLSGPRARFRRVKAVDGKCAKPRFLRATGLDRWSYRLRRMLPKGSYRLLVRATLTDGAAHDSFSSASGNMRAFRVR